MRRWGRFVGLLGVVALLGSGCDWLQWGGGPTHTGTIPETVISKGNVAALVSSRMAPLPTSSAAATSNGLVFIAAGGTLTALDAKTYAMVWSGSLPGSSAGSAPAVHARSGTVFVVVAASNPVLVGFDVNGVRNCNPVLNTCSPVFVAQLGTAFGPASPPVVDGGKVIANGAGAVFAFDATGGTNCVSSLGQATCGPLWSAVTDFSLGGVGPAVANGVVYDAVRTGGSFALGAFAKDSGASLWTGSMGAAPSAAPSVGADGSVFAPAGPMVDVFKGDGCGAATCPPSFSLARRIGDAPGAFLSTPAIDGPNVYATNRNGSLYAWPNTSCGAPTCQPTFVVNVDAPAGAAAAYNQSPVITNGVLVLLTRQVIAAANHVVLVARDEANGAPLASWDLGVVKFGAGLANASIAGGVVYAPVASALFAVHPRPVEPLASLSTSPLVLSPSFSPSTFDYVLRCASGTNSVTLDMSAVPGGSVALVAPTTTQPSASQTATVALNANQAAVVEAKDANGAAARYWVRCLPSDFPPLTATAHPAAGAPSPGWYLVGNNFTPAGTASYAMILDSRGTPVWYKRTAQAALNLTPLGHDALAVMSTLALTGFGTDPNGHYDAYFLDNGTSTTIRTVGVPTDFHELYLLPNGRYLLLSYPLRRGVDLTGLPATPTPGASSTIADCVVQEVTPQGALVWQWTASDHIDPVTETTVAPTVTINGETVYDVFHCNSIDARASGDLLVSARHLDAAFEIRRSDGKVVWKLGGTPVNKDGASIIAIQNDPAGGIVLQHDARYLPNNHISIFDNRSTQAATPARAVEYAVDLVAKTARPVFSFSSPDGPSCCMGSFRRYPDGHGVIGWGYVPPSNGAVFTEVNAAGQSVFDVRFASNYASYRAVKVPPPRFDVDRLRATAGQ